MRAVTDTGPTEPNSEMSEAVKNLFTILEIVSEKQAVDFFREKYNSCEIRYGDLKKQLAEDVNKIISPIREKIIEIDANNDYLKKTAKEGAEKARQNATKTIKDVREIMGFKIF